jgi:hypothetical protein
MKVRLISVVLFTALHGFAQEEKVQFGLTGGLSYNYFKFKKELAGTKPLSPSKDFRWEFFRMHSFFQKQKIYYLLRE